jgi:hypothetical protein
MAAAWNLSLSLRLIAIAYESLQLGMKNILTTRETGFVKNCKHAYFANLGAHNFYAVGNCSVGNYTQK